MPKYMISGKYSVDGLQGVIKEGGTGRYQAAKQVIESAGGTLESYYFTFGSDDFFGVVDLPDNVTAAALSILMAATGAFSPRITVLLTPEEIDAATKTAVDYRPPGQ
jgi:uncharacterized protein with GYD domain